MAAMMTLALSYVNGEYWGLYDLVEKVSKPFLESRLGEGTRVTLLLPEHRDAPVRG